MPKLKQYSFLSVVTLLTYMEILPSLNLKMELTSASALLPHLISVGMRDLSCH